MTHQEFQTAQQKHLNETLSRHNVTSISHLALDRDLKQHERILKMDVEQARRLKAKETAACLETARCAVQDARTSLASEHYRREAEQ